MERIANLHIEKLPEGVYPATSDDIPGLVAQGRTLMRPWRSPTMSPKNSWRRRPDIRLIEAMKGTLRSCPAKNGIGYKCPEMVPFPALSR